MWSFSAAARTLTTVYSWDRSFGLLIYTSELACSGYNLTVYRTWWYAIIVPYEIDEFFHTKKASALRFVIYVWRTNEQYRIPLRPNLFPLHFTLE